MTTMEIIIMVTLMIIGHILLYLIGKSNSSDTNIKKDIELQKNKCKQIILDSYTFHLWVTRIMPSIYLRYDTLEIAIIEEYMNSFLEGTILNASDFTIEEKESLLKEIKNDWINILKNENTYRKSLVKK